MLDTLRFWLDRGVAGFRLDAITTLFEDPQLRNEPQQAGVNARGDPIVSRVYTDHLPEVHGVIQRMRKMIDSYPADRVLIGETYLPNTAELDEWYGARATMSCSCRWICWSGSQTGWMRRPCALACSKYKLECMGRSPCSYSTTTTMSAAGIVMAALLTPPP